MNYKVWGRESYTETIRSWAREMLWCHVVIRLFRYDIESIVCKCGSYGEPQ